MIGGLLERNPRIAQWIWGFKPPERGTIILVHRRVYILPTRLGWLFAATLLILLIGLPNSARAGPPPSPTASGWRAWHTARNLARIVVSTGALSWRSPANRPSSGSTSTGRSRCDRPAIRAPCRSGCNS
jgi:hypothetical protein